ncbi:MAG: hypothetical protein AB8D78_15630, partial [Akkermansiaceae bacterium]
LETSSRTAYRLGDGSQHIEMFSYDPADREAFKLPNVNGKPINLDPKAVYESPYLNGLSGSREVKITVGPIQKVLNFSNNP